MRNGALSRRDEARLLKAYQRVLMGEGFPNPDRAGCPDNETLKAMAFRKLSHEELMGWIDHLGTCTPCFREYTEFRNQAEWRRTLAYVGVAASVLVALFGLWRWRSSRPNVITAHNHIVADMRDRLIMRGEQGAGPGKGPLVFGRGIDDVSFYLPEGSRTGTYEVAVFDEESGESLVRTTGTAVIKNNTTAVNVTLDLSRTTPGHYLVGIRLPGTDWNYANLIIR
jgi:hypothetical protein